MTFRRLAEIIALLLNYYRHDCSPPPIRALWRELEADTNAAPPAPSPEVLAAMETADIIDARYQELAARAKAMQEALWTITSRADSLAVVTAGDVRDALIALRRQAAEAAGGPLP